MSQKTLQARTNSDRAQPAAPAAPAASPQRRAPAATPQGAVPGVPRRKLDELEQFCAWFLKNMPVIGAVPFAGAVTRIQDVTGILLYRKDQFQVQMFAVPEGTIIPEHTHPNVDSIEVYVGGNIHFSHSGKYVYPKEMLGPNAGPLGLALKRGQLIRVRPNDVHGGVFGEGGGVFLSVQHWQNGVAPHCVSADYDGLTMGEHHLAGVKYGEATAKKVLAPKDAASLEH